MNSAHRTLVIIGLIALSACTLGPDFKRPAAPEARQYDEKERSGLIAQGATAPVAAPWWQAYGSPTLDAWVSEGLAKNRDLRSTQASLVAAQARLAAQIGASELPRAGVEAQYQHQRAIGLPDFGPPTNVYRVFAGVVEIDYDLDLFGGIRRANEAASAVVDAQGFELAAARESLAANIVTLAIRSSAQKEQVAASERLCTLAREETRLTQRRLEFGSVTRRDLFDVERRSHDTCASLPGQRAAWAASRNALAVLIGRTPENAPADLDFGELHLPANIPVLVPSELAHQRPDVLAAESRLHAATAQVGVATANLYPQISLTGTGGSESFTRAGFLTGKTAVWGLVGGITQPLFAGGSLLAQKRASSADLDAALARYESTVLRAFQNVADSLRALDEDGAAAAERAASDAAARALFDDTVRRHASGSASQINEVTSEESWQVEHIGRISAQALLLSDSAALSEALGSPVPAAEPPNGN